MKIILAIYFLIIYLKSPGQDTCVLHSRQDTVDCLTELMRKAGYIGMGYQSDQYLRYIFLLKLMKGRDFMNLTKSDSPCLRVYGLMGLYYNNQKESKRVRRILKKDTATISVLVWDASDDYSVSGFVRKISKNFWEEEIRKDLIIIDIKEAKQDLFERAMNRIN